MTTASFVHSVEFWLALGCLVGLFYGPWQSFVMEVLRQSIFQLRDSLFLAAADGKIAFTSAEYLRMRERFNMMIRYAHSANWAHILSVIVCRPKTIRPFDIQEIVGRIPDKEVAGMVFDYYQRAMLYTMLAVVARSLVLLLTNIVCAPFILVLLILNDRKINDSVGRAINADVDIEQERGIRAAA